MPDPDSKSRPSGNLEVPLALPAGDGTDVDLQWVLAVAKHNAEGRGAVRRAKGQDLTWSDLAQVENEVLDLVREAIWRRTKRAKRVESDRIVKRRRNRTYRMRMNRQLFNNLRARLAMAQDDGQRLQLRLGLARTLTHESLFQTLLARKVQQAAQLREEEMILEHARSAVRARLNEIHRQNDSERGMER